MIHDEVEHIVHAALVIGPPHLPVYLRLVVDKVSSFFALLRHCCAISISSFITQRLTRNDSAPHPRSILSVVGDDPSPFLAKHITKRLMHTVCEVRVFLWSAPCT